jgi:hypothetical protein
MMDLTPDGAVTKDDLVQFCDLKDIWDIRETDKKCKVVDVQASLCGCNPMQTF